MDSPPARLMPPHSTLSGKIGLVTGAAAGIGAGIATAFARFGAELAICDRDAAGLVVVENEIGVARRHVESGVLDVRDSEAVGEWIDRVETRFGRVDVLVNNVGGTFRAGFADLSINAEAALIAENFTQVTEMTRRVLPLMSAGGSIINVTSIEAHRGAPGFAIYAAMKAAVTNLTKSLALELSDRGIRVNAIAPDAIPTPGHADLEHEAGGRSDENARTPLRIRGVPDDCAGPAIFLASDLARFVTGTVVHVDGGNDAARGWTRSADGSWTP